RMMLPLREQLKRKGSKRNWAAFQPNAKDLITRLRESFDAQLSELSGSGKGFDLGVDERLLEIMPTLAALHGQAAEIYDRAKERRRVLDFDDLEREAVELLKSGACAAWLDGIGAVLVDEYQDTNERQRGLVELMAEAAGRLFVVGDAKQSIYRFRGADVSVFEAQEKEIAHRGGARVALQRSYRACEPLVEILNPLLAGVLAEHNQYVPAQDDLVAGYRPADQRMQGEDEPLLGAPYLELHVALGSKGDQGLYRAAAGLAERLHELVREPEHGLSYGDIAVLCRASSSFADYEAAFSAMGLPYVVGAGRGFYERPEVRDLLNALQALADPDDDVALAGLLRSPVFAFDDVELFTVAQQEGNIWAEKLSALVEKGIPRAWAAQERIERLRAQAARLPAGRALHVFLEETGYRAALHLAGQTRAVRNVDKLLAEAHAAESSIAAFLQAIAELRAAPTREGEAPEAAADAVRLMTVHAAKGLGFQVVVLGDITYNSPSFRQLIVSERWGVVPPVQNADGVTATIYELARQEEKTPQEKELRRLLYVAATRARQKLILNGCFSTFNNDGTPRRSGEWLQWADADLGFFRRSFADENLSQPRLCFEMQAASVPVTGWLYTEAYEPGAAAGAATVTWSAAWSGNLPSPAEEMTPGVSDPQNMWRVTAADDSKSAIPGRIVGSLVHDALAAWCLPGDDHFDGWVRARAFRYGLVDEAHHQQALDRVRELLQRFRNHALYETLVATTRHHELPYYTDETHLPASDAACEGAGQTTAEEHAAGDAADAELRSRSIDLLYQDPQDSRWVVLDFKLNQLSAMSDEALRRWATVDIDYAQQVRRYADAVEKLLQLTYTPRCELCLLDYGGQVKVLEINAPAPDP
ncbi:MAG: 3'-5' exonuclease, partial [Candidatus Promineifilaceae bacterium]|nr:3'-5' exonuclease [Candidatus Promineifilaceae bacterium]